MNCRDFEQLIALDAWGDLPAADAERVREHLEACAECQALAAELAASQAALVAVRVDALDERALAPWRRGVMDRIETGGRRRFAWRTAWAAAIAAVFVLAVGLVAIRRTPPEPVPVAALVTSPPPPAAARPPLAPQPRPAVRVRHRTPKRRPAVAAEPLLVRLETPDPNVVIYWIVEGKGD